VNTNTLNDIRDIKGMVPVPHEWWWLWVLLAVIVAGGVALWLWKRRKVTTAAEVIVPPSPLEVALAALRRLREENLPVDVFYTRLSNIVRQYIEGRFGLRAPERTTEEFLAEAALPEQHMKLLRPFLQECDLVKFAKFTPGEADRHRAFEAAEKFVTEAASDWRASLPASRDSQPTARQEPRPPAEKML
jgi:hypothetical protein